MADNLAVTPGTGATIAADDVGGVLYQTIKLDIGAGGASAPLAAGRQDDADSIPVALSTENAALIGAANETAPSADTDPSGLNGRLQRLAQQLTALSAQLPAELDTGGRLKVHEQIVATVQVSPTLITNASDSAVTSGDNEIIEAPAAGYRIVITSILLQNADQSTLDLILKNGASEILRIHCPNEGDGILKVYPLGREMRLNNTTALNLNLSDDLTAYYSIDYFIEDGS